MAEITFQNIAFQNPFRGHMPPYLAGRADEQACSSARLAAALGWLWVENAFTALTEDSGSRLRRFAHGLEAVSRR